MTETEEIYNDEGFEEDSTETSPKTPSVKAADADPEDAF